MSMVERVARALQEGDDEFAGKPITSWYRGAALAAIEAMREPTDSQRNRYFEMKKASGCSPRDSVFFDAEWERMIDAALAAYHEGLPMEEVEPDTRKTVVIKYGMGG